MGQFTKLRLVSSISLSLSVLLLINSSFGQRPNILNNQWPYQNIFRNAPISNLIEDIRSNSPLSRFGRDGAVSTISLIKANGYPSETHWVTTDDGYILELHRIPYGLDSPEGPAKIPVIIQHGNFQSSGDWMINKPANNCLPLLLADNGYDVWLGNQRGNSYSKQHVKYPTNSFGFWNYSYHEAALYDVPAVIDYVLEQTGSKKVQYISHSVGCKNFMAGLSLRPEYNEKVGIGITMGPAAYMGHMFNGYARLLSPILRYGEAILNIVGPIPIMPQGLSAVMRTALPMLCRESVDVIGLCSAIFFGALGEDREQISPEQIVNIKSVFPSPTSFKLWIHLVQEIQSGHYRQFDYGIDRNIEVYGRPNPPDYDLSKVTVPMSILHGERDHIARVEDTEALAKVLPNVVDFYVVPWKKWTHMDFSYAKDAGILCYAHILEMLEKYKF